MLQLIVEKLVFYFNFFLFFFIVKKVSKIYHSNLS